jgi:hypothetical protein
MPYVNTLTGQFGASLSDAEKAEPGVFAYYTATSRPSHNAYTQLIEEAAPIAGVQQWAVIALTGARLVEGKQRELAQYLSNNNDLYEGALNAITAGYPPSEIATWERQREEAVAWNADNAVATPWIDIAAQARGIPRTEYLSRTYAKATQFAHASAYLTGLRQRYETAINSAADPATVVVDYTLPGAP